MRHSDSKFFAARKGRGDANLGAPAGWLGKVPSDQGPLFSPTGVELSPSQAPSRAWEQHETCKRGPPFATTATSSFNVQMAHIRCQMVVQRGTICTFRGRIRLLTRLQETEALTIGLLHDQYTGRRPRHTELAGGLWDPI